MAEHPEKLGPTVRRIAHKHVSLAIQPAQYAMVGEALLMALSEKLNVPMEHDIIQAWGEAYGELAEIFIAQEQDLNQANADKICGWQGFRPFVISRIVHETPQSKSLYLQPADGKPLATFQAGQYVSVKLTDVPDHPYDEMRQYSLSDQPGLPHYRISVKAEPGNPQGLVSNHLHTHAKPGDEILLSAPCGDFVLPNQVEREVVLISAGVGITPMMSMLKTALQTEDRQHAIRFIHCAQDRQQHCFADELSQLQAQQAFHYFQVFSNSTEGDHQGRIDQAALDTFLSENPADFYFCGPFPFMVALKHVLVARAVPEERIHYEVFGPTLSLGD